MSLGNPGSAEDGKQTYVIAEMAWAHNGSLENALALLRGAREAGANALGIHLTSMPDYMVPGYLCRDGQTLSGDRGGPQQEGEIYRYLDRLNLTHDQWRVVFREARACGMDLCAMCNDAASLGFARDEDAAAVYALAAACFTEYDFVRSVASLGKPMVLRIGGATLGEIERTVNLIREAGNQQVVLLHGIQLYPTDPAALNLALLRTLQEAFRCQVGLADHIDGGLPEALVLPLLALPYGATVIEKHITLDRSLKHEDYEAALGVAEFRRFVDYIRAAESAIGTGTFRELTAADQKYRRVSRKRVVARHPLAQGHVIGHDDIAFKRSDLGIDPGDLELLLGRTAARPIARDEGLDLDKIV